MGTISFLVDEDMGPSIATPLKAMNHTVTLVTKVLGEGAPDAIVCALAEAMGATVVTRNGRDYLKILARHDGSDEDAFRKAGCLVLACPTHDVARKRLRLFRELWELEHGLVTSESDSRVIVEITPETLRVVR